MVSVMTALTWLSGTVGFSQFHSQSLTRAATVAAVRAVGALVVWSVYIATSRQKDGSERILLAIFLVGLVSLSPGHSGILGEATFILFLVFSMALAGLLVRRLGKAGGRPTNSPLWDAEMDPPSTR
jgi:hypothetical protein